jgi:hypothetical protein
VRKTQIGSTAEREPDLNIGLYDAAGWVVAVATAAGCDGVVCGTAAGCCAETGAADGRANPLVDIWSVTTVVKLSAFTPICESFFL